MALINLVAGATTFLIDVLLTLAVLVGILLLTVIGIHTALMLVRTLRTTDLRKPPPLLKILTLKVLGQEITAEMLPDRAETVEDDPTPIEALEKRVETLEQNFDIFRTILEDEMRDPERTD